jgi:elongation factor Tu
MITGASQMDGAVLLVDASQGAELQTREHVLLARQVGVEQMVVFINKVDVADPEFVDLVEMEVQELLAAHGFADSPCVRGSALLALQAAEAGQVDSPDAACIHVLVDTLDGHITVPERDLGAPFMMPIEGVCTIPGRGTVVTGRVERGRLPVQARVELVGRGDDSHSREVVVTGIQEFHADIPEALAGLNVGLLLRGVGRDEVERGQVAVAPGSLRPHVGGSAEIFVLTPDEGGRHTPFASGYTPQFYFGATDVSATLDTGEHDCVCPGDRAKVSFALATPTAFEPGMRFAIREGGKTVGAGVVTDAG